jgi:hypothetical protein
VASLNLQLRCPHLSVRCLQFQARPVRKQRNFASHPPANSLSLNVLPSRHGYPAAFLFSCDSWYQFVCLVSTASPFHGSQRPSPYTSRPDTPFQVREVTLGAVLLCSQAEHSTAQYRQFTILKDSRLFHRRGLHSRPRTSTRCTMMQRYTNWDGSSKYLAIFRSFRQFRPYKTFDGSDILLLRMVPEIDIPPHTCRSF